MTSTRLWRPAVLVKTRVWLGCSVSPAHKNWSRSFFIFKDFLSDSLPITPLAPAFLPLKSDPERLGTRAKTRMNSDYPNYRNALPWETGLWRTSQLWTWISTLTACVQNIRRHTDPDGKAMNNQTKTKIVSTNLPDAFPFGRQTVFTD